MLSTITDEVKHCFCEKTDGNANAFQLLPDSVREGYVPRARLDASRHIAVLWSCMQWGNTNLAQKEWSQRMEDGERVPEDRYAKSYLHCIFWQYFC